MAHPIVAVHTVHHSLFRFLNLFRREGLGHVIIFDCPAVRKRRPHPADLLLVFVRSNVLDGVGNMPVNSVPESHLTCPGPGLQQQIGVRWGVVLVLSEAGNLPHRISVERWREVAQLARFIGWSHRLRFQRTIVRVKDDLW